MHNLGFTSGAAIAVQPLVNLRHLAALLPLAQQQKVFNQHDGQYRSALRGRGMDYSEVRQYQAGDDLRSMDWRVTARTGKPHVKVYQQEKERPVFIVCDLRANMFFGSRRALKSVLAADISALLAWASLYHGDRVGALLFNETQEINLRPKPGRSAVLLLLNKLVELGQRPAFGASNTPEHAAQRMQQICRHLRRVALPGSRIYFISDWLGFNDHGHQQLFEVSRHSDLFALHISDPLERELPPPGLYPISDGTQQVQLDSINSAHRRAYQTQFSEQLQQLQNRLFNLQIPLIPIGTEQPQPLEVLRAGLGVSHA